LTTKKTGSGGAGGGSKTGKAKGDGDERAGAAKRTAARKAPARPRLRSSYAGASSEKAAKPRRAAGPSAGAKRRAPAGEPGEHPAAPRPRSPSLPPGARKAALGGPRRAGRKGAVAEPALEASPTAREVALAIAGIGLEKKALGIEILDVASKVDYAEILVIMTGRSDRHVHAIASGLEEAMRKRRTPAVSIEGMAAATWVLLDFSDVVVHVFQEDTRRLYDIEGLWIDASRIPVPEDAAKPHADGPAAD
jgi:ribosome-associated protein